MLDIFGEEKVLSGAMFFFMLFSIFLRIFLGLLYQNMIREADNMAATENKLLKQCKLKFANCYELSGGVANIPIFVDKFLDRLSLGHLSFGVLYHLSGQTMLLSVVCSGAAVCKGIVDGRTVGDILPFYIASLFGLYAYFSVSTVVDIKGKRRTLKINLVDYLENHLSPRIQVTRQDIEMLYGEAMYSEAVGTGGITDAAQGRGGTAGVGSRRKQVAIAGLRGRRAGGRGGRQTVELMPISGRAAAPTRNADAFPGADSLRVAGAERLRTIPRSGDADSTQRMDAEQTGAIVGSGRSPGESTESYRESAAVTEEELEALLKEFLAT